MKIIIVFLTVALICSLGALAYVTVNQHEPTQNYINDNGSVVQIAKCIAIVKTTPTKNDLVRVQIELDRKVFNRTGTVVFNGLALPWQVGEFNGPERTSQTSMVNVYLDQLTLRWLCDSVPCHATFTWR